MIVLDNFNLKYKATNTIGIDIETSLLKIGEIPLIPGEIFFALL